MSRDTLIDPLPPHVLFGDNVASPLPRVLVFEWPLSILTYAFNKSVFFRLILLLL